MVAKESRDDIDDSSSDLEKEPKHEEEEESDCETVKDYVSSQGDAHASEYNKMERASRVPKKLAKKDSAETYSCVSREKSDWNEANKTPSMGSHTNHKKSAKSNGGSPKITTLSKNMKVHPQSSSEGFDGKCIKEVKEIDFLDEAPNGLQSVGSDNETEDMEENGLGEDQETIDQRIREMKLRIEKLEEELIDVASLEISLYSVVAEHGSSAHKVHTPARRLSRLYIHACKYWTQDKRATIAKNTVSGLVLIAKSCGNDVQRLTFWLSNVVVLREILSQAFGNSLHSSMITRIIESNGGVKRSEVKSSSLKWKGGTGSKQVKIGFTQFVDDWQETTTFTSSLEKVESWIFSRIVESVWWQTLTPCMQPPAEEMYSIKSHNRLLGPTLGDQQQGCFSINLWKSAFHDAFQRLCPVRSEGHECGCLPILARMVMEQCVARLDVAMFNAILRESAHEIPTDPVSDPIVDSKVLPIPAGDLSFGSGAQLKNSVGNLSRCLTDLFGMDSDDSLKDESEDRHGGDAEPKSFLLLNALSDLLMLPKEMLMDRSIRKEVSPSIGLSLIKRILCNFTPDEFCPDPVPGAVLEALNAEVQFSKLSKLIPLKGCLVFSMESTCQLDHKEAVIEQDGELSDSFPYSAAPVIYVPPSSANIAQKVGDVRGKCQLGRNASIIQRKGYTSDDELDELGSPLTYIIHKTPSSVENGNERHKEKESYGNATVRYELLRQVWTV